MTVEITYSGELLSVEGTFIEGESQTWLDPGCPDEFEIEKIFFQEVDVTNLLENTGLDMNDLESKVLEKIKNL